MTAQDMKAQYHSELAMAAAKKMRSTKQKQKTGKAVCHHLRMMLASEPVAVSKIDIGNKLVSLQASNDDTVAPQFQLGF